jgi:hypothetical protein
MVLMVKYFFVLSTFQVSGMIGLSQQIFCLNIHKMIERNQICVDQGFPTSGDAAEFLVGPIS